MSMEQVSNVGIKSRMKQLVILVVAIVIGVVISHLVEARRELQKENESYKAISR